MKPPSETTAVMDLTPRDLEDLVEELRASHALSSPVFQRREPRAHAAKYLQGLLWELPRKSIEPLVLALEGAKAHAVRAMQQCISEGSWADTALLPRHWHEVARFARVRVLAVREGLPGPDLWCCATTEERGR